MSQEFEGVKIFKAQGGLNREGLGTDAHMAIVVHVPAFPDNIASNDVIELLQVLDAETKGINAAFDANNNVLVHYHIDEFFRYAPEGKLTLVLTAEETAAAFFAQDVAKAIVKNQSDAKRIGFVYNNNVADLDLQAELTACQGFIEALAEEHYLLDGITLEGRNIGTDAIDNRVLDCGNCHVVIAQDPAIASVDPAYANYAAVGTYLGMRAARKPNENLGSLDIENKPDYAKGDLTFPLTYALKGRWLSAALSNGTAYDTLTGVQKDTLTARAYIYAGSYSGSAGIYFNGEPTCIDIASDYAQGENNNIWNKAARGIRTALLPRVKSRVKIDPASGFIRNTSAKYLESVGIVPLNKMLSDDEVSDYSLEIPTNQTPSDQTPLKVKGSVTKDRIIHLFEVDLGLK